MKKLLILIICLMVLTSCKSVDENETKIIIYKTPIYIYNTGVSGEMEFSLPIKSFRVIESAGMEFKLKDDIMDSKDLGKLKINNLKKYLKYNDAKKYKKIKCKLSGDVIEPSGSVFIEKYYAILEVEAYTSELKDSKVDEIINGSVFVMYKDKLLGTSKELEAIDADFMDLNGIFGAATQQIKQEEDKSFETFKSNENQEFYSLIAKLDIRLSSLRDTKSKTKEISSFLSDYLEYSEDIDRFQSVEQALKIRKGACYDKAILFDLVAKYYGLQTDLHMGITVNDEGRILYHAWNVVFDENVIYLVDTSEKIFYEFKYGSPISFSGILLYKIYSPQTSNYEEYTIEKNSQGMTLKYLIFEENK